MAISAFELIFNVADQYYHGGTIRASHNKCEVFFHMPWGSRIGATFYDTSRNIEETGCGIDHYSFHNDGTIHGKGRGEKKKTKYYNKLGAGQNIFNLERGHFLPIYLQSVNVDSYKNPGGKLRQLDSKPTALEHSWDITGLNSFSLVLVSACARVSPMGLMSQHGFQNLTMVGTPLSLANIITAHEKALLQGGCRSGFDTQLLIFVVEETWSEPPPTEPPKSTNGLISVDICLPPMPLISKMRNRNR